MAKTINVPRAHLILGICIPLAVLLGYLLAEPLEPSSMAVVVLVVFALSVPLLMNWHHPLLVLAWNSQMAPIFLPGQPPLWLILAFGSLLFAVLSRAVNPNRSFVHVPSLSRPLIFFALTVIVTAFMTGGIGLRTLGSDKFGGKGYFYLLGSVAGYFAFTSARIPAGRADAYTAMFFLPGLAGVMGNLIYSAGPSFYFLYGLFPITVALEQAGADMSGAAYSGRFGGLMMTSAALYSVLLARYGMRGILDLQRPMRLFLFLLAAAGCLESGYRSVLILFLMVAGAVFYLEGLHRTRILAVLAAVGLVTGAVCLSQSEKLPLAVQRSLSFLPVEVDPSVRQNVDASSQWRVEMWKVIAPEIPHYLFKGKGYSLDPNEMDMAALTDASHPETYSMGSLLSGAYHNGGLSVIIPFGLFGLVGFLWFIVASLRYLHYNYAYGDPSLRRINTFLYGAFAAKSLFFFTVFGALYVDFFYFTGLVGFAVALNGARGDRPLQEDAQPEPLPRFSARVVDV